DIKEAVNPVLPAAEVGHSRLSQRSQSGAFPDHKWPIDRGGAGEVQREHFRVKRAGRVPNLAEDLRLHRSVCGDVIIGTAICREDGEQLRIELLNLVRAAGRANDRAKRAVLLVLQRYRQAGSMKLGAESDQIRVIT